jgi:hypothetical protein
MSEEDRQDVMSDVISDISSASEETTEEARDEAQEEVEESREAVQEVAEAIAQAAIARDEGTPSGAKTIVVKFDDDIEAARAVRVINKALRKRDDTIYQGAVVRRKKEDKLQVEDFKDLGLTDLVTDTAAIGIDLGRDSFRLVWNAAASGFGIVTGGVRLLRRSVLQALGVGGATLTLHRRRQLDAFEPEEDVQASTTRLVPGETAVIIVADSETANELATDLVRSGGELT